MNKKWLIPSIIGALVLLIGLMVIGTYNGLIKSREEVRTSLSNVKTQYQRRMDLVDNLVSTVKGAADFEKSTLTDLAEKRSNVGKVTLPDNATTADIQRFMEAQNAMTGSLNKLIAVSENYPSLKATEAFRDLMVQLEGTENRIQVARSDYNNIAKPYNTKLQTFPSGLVAKMFNFEQSPYFESTGGVEKAPKVDFSNKK